MPTGEYDKVQTLRALAEGCKQTCSSSVSASLTRSFISSAASSTWMVQSVAWFFFLDIASCVWEKKSVHLKTNSFSSEGRDRNLQEWSGNLKIQTTLKKWKIINVCTCRWVVVRFRSFKRLWAATPVEMLSKVDLLSSIVRTDNRMSSVKSQMHLSQPDKKKGQHNFSLVFVSATASILNSCNSALDPWCSLCHWCLLVDTSFLSLSSSHFQGYFYSTVMTFLAEQHQMGLLKEADTGIL